MLGLKLIHVSKGGHCCRHRPSNIVNDFLNTFLFKAWNPATYFIAMVFNNLLQTTIDWMVAYAYCVKLWGFLHGFYIFVCIFLNSHVEVLYFDQRNFLILYSFILITKKLHGDAKGPFYWHGLTLITAWKRNYISYKVWAQINYISQTSTVKSLKFGNGWVISFHILHWYWDWN